MMWKMWNQRYFVYCVLIDVDYFVDEELGYFAYFRALKSSTGPANGGKNTNIDDQDSEERSLNVENRK